MKGDEWCGKNCLKSLEGNGAGGGSLMFHRDCLAEAVVSQCGEHVGISADHSGALLIEAVSFLGITNTSAVPLFITGFQPSRKPTSRVLLYGVGFDLHTVPELIILTLSIPPNPSLASDDDENCPVPEVVSEQHSGNNRMLGF
jgi:hypothetical protein